MNNEGKLDDIGSGHVMAYINDPSGRICSWGIPLAECYGLRLPRDPLRPRGQPSRTTGT